ncbi:hypothetical protein C4K01_2580 [Pseudomonas synxantha]|nr:hypothetical protein C4K01_2580 [Pseudomonas synxantha]
MWPAETVHGRWRAAMLTYWKKYSTRNNYGINIDCRRWTF